MESTSDVVYIPRVSSFITERTIQDAFYNLRVGIVAYVDFVATKQPETKEIMHYSAFVKISSWDYNTKPVCEFKRNGTYKLFLGQYGSGDPNETFWILLPGKNPLPRSKVNTHQLAAATDKLFEKCETTATELLKKDEEIKILNEVIACQNEKIEQLQSKFELDRLENDAKYDEMMYLIKELQSQVKYMSMPPAPAIKRLSSTDAYDSGEDDCIYSKPVKTFNFDSPPRLSSEEQIKYPERPASVSPPVLEDSTRFAVTRDFCGNA